MIRPMALLVVLLVPLASVEALSPPACSDLQIHHAECTMGVDAIRLDATGPCYGEDPECGPFTWLIEVTSCSDLPGALVVEWEFFLAEAPAFGGVALTQATGEDDCPHRATYRRTYGGGTFTMPTECVFVKAASPAGAAARLLCLAN